MNSEKLIVVSERNVILAVNIESRKLTEITAFRVNSSFQPFWLKIRVDSGFLRSCRTFTRDFSSDSS